MSDGAGGRFSLSRHLPALRYDNFRLLFFATLGSGVGTWMATIALTLDVFDRTGSTWWVAALFIVTFVPSVIVGLVRRPTGRPALAQAAGRHRRPRAARRVLRAAVRRHTDRDHRARGRRGHGQLVLPAGRPRRRAESRVGGRSRRRDVARCRRPTGWRPPSARSSAGRSSPGRARTSSTGSTRPRSCSRRCSSFGSPRGFSRASRASRAAACAISGTDSTRSGSLARS